MVGIAATAGGHSHCFFQESVSSMIGSGKQVRSMAEPDLAVAFGGKPGGGTSRAECPCRPSLRWKNARRNNCSAIASQRSYTFGQMFRHLGLPISCKPCQRTRQG